MERYEFLTYDWQLLNAEQIEQMKVFMRDYWRYNAHLLRVGRPLPDGCFLISVSRPMGEQHYATAYSYNMAGIQRLMDLMGQQTGLEAVEDWSDLLNQGAYELGLRRPPEKGEG